MWNSLGRRGNNMTIEYTIPKGETICSVTEDHIEKCVLESASKSTRELDVTEAQIINLRHNIQLIHTPNQMPTLDPYTRHGDVPIEYRRMLSFVWCCRDVLPRCQFSYLCTQILEIYFLLAERHIEQFCSNSKPLKVAQPTQDALLYARSDDSSSDDTPSEET